MPGKAVGRAAADLPWLCPNAESLIALAERPADAAALQADTAFQIFLLRFARSDSSEPSVTLSPERLQAPTLPETAAAYLATTRAGWADRSHSVYQSLNHFGAAAAQLAEALARLTGRADPEEAARAARLATLGWHAVLAVEAEAASDCRGDSRFPTHAATVQTERWGLSHDAIARRLATRWRFPDRFSAVVGQLNLPFRAARLLAGSADLFGIVQLAVREAERRLGSWGLTLGADAEELYARFGLEEGQLHSLPLERAGDSPANAATHPNDVPLLPNLLRMAAESRRRNGASLVLRLEARVDQLQSALAEMAQGTTERIREARLRGLAELAAGAGHEINNPLMVIAGHTQRLRQKETDPEREAVLRTIERQTERIAVLIKGLMQFARPPRPQRQRWPAADLVRALGNDLQAEATNRHVQLELLPPPADLAIEADRDQVRQALRAVILNALEAVPDGGWVRLRAEAEERGAFAFVVEDSGPGIPADQREFLFDPFYCGRSAGRGKGLGLSIAWRLATQNGGTVRHESPADGGTRFRLVFARAADENAYLERKSA